MAHFSNFIPVPSCFNHVLPISPNIKAPRQEYPTVAFAATIFDVG